MSFTLEQLIEIFPDRLWLQFSSEERDRIWLQAQTYSNQSSRWTAYLNLLCLNSFLQYINSDPDLQNESLKICFSDLDKIGKSSLWEFINGTALEIGDRRLILIPQDTVSPDEFSVPWEWVDIPALAGDYYLAVEVNVDHQWLQFWGYTTHQKLKEKADYESRDRTYNLPKKTLIEDIEVLWVARELCLPERTELEMRELPNLSHRKQQDFLIKWSQNSTYSPRLELKEEELTTWTALLISDRDRLDLYKRRINSQKNVHLGAWLKNIFETNWQSLEDILDNIVDTSKEPEMKPMYAFRGKETNSWGNSTTTIPAIIDLLNTNINSSNTFRGVQRAKRIDLDIKLDIPSVALIVTVVPEKNKKAQVHFRISSLNLRDYLPTNLNLEILDEEGQVFDRIVSHQSDNIIQCGLQCNYGDTFGVKVTLGEISFQEQFIL
ncbi:DUF1822 family protein [Spirulina sp. 06S082]|uniref:DUF1822 family protein n=1 Tax=Spirulina sp. 06S082 TaxID=3110248 RepID=UPI002B20EEBF|nr:DUF1822 family protein [Spirulina sp. 06S082]MEA5470426.1 DUF1822 family protein [Spirulina sp. 06S082]